MTYEETTTISKHAYHIITYIITVTEPPWHSLCRSVEDVYIEVIEPLSSSNQVYVIMIDELSDELSTYS